MQQVLVVDPDPETARILEIVLEDLPVKVTAADGSIQAWRQIALERPTLVVSEQALGPGTDGFTFLRTLKREWPTVDCFLYTATPVNMPHEQLPDMLEHSDIAVLFKPCEPNVLRTLVAYLLGWIA